MMDVSTHDMQTKESTARKSMAQRKQARSKAKSKAERIKEAYQQVAFVGPFC